jgi:hypothetical protein
MLEASGDRNTGAFRSEQRMALGSERLGVRRYRSGVKVAWDAFVRQTENGAFLFMRDYDRDRFDDQSIVVMDGHEVVALMPAHLEACTMHSPLGLTYRGLVVAPSVCGAECAVGFEAGFGGRSVAHDWYRIDLALSNRP